MNKRFTSLFLLCTLFVACQQTVLTENQPQNPEPNLSPLKVDYREVLVTGTSNTSAESYMDGALKDARFGQIADLAFDTQGNFYVADRGNHVIRYVDLESQNVSTFAGQVYDAEETTSTADRYHNGPAREARFAEPVSLALASDGTLYVADSTNHKIRKIARGQVSTILGDSPENRPPGEKPDLKYPLRQSGDLATATVFLPSLLKVYNERYLFLYETYSTNRYIDLEKNLILGAVDTFGSESQIKEREQVAPEYKYADFGDVLEIVFDGSGGAWTAYISPVYSIKYRSVSGEHKKTLGKNKTILCDFLDYCWSIAQKDGDFESFSFNSPINILAGNQPDYLFVHDLYRNSTAQELRTSSLRLYQISLIK